MKNTFKTYLGSVEVGQKQFYKNLTVYPLIADYAVSMAYLTLDEALERDVVAVAEIDKDGAISKRKADIQFTIGPVIPLSCKTQPNRAQPYPK
jgi:hypothetical protein